MAGPPRVVGIVAGGGSLPREVAEHVRASGAAVHVVAIDGEFDRDLAGIPVTHVGWAQFGALLRALRNAGTTEVVIAGAVRRPDLTRIRPDLGFFLNLPAIVRIVTSGGDDSVLTRVVRFFEGKGFKVVSPAQVAPSLVVGEGALGAHAASASDQRDIDLGFALVRALGQFDVGQAVVVADGRVEAIEGAENTDAMLARLGLQRISAGRDVSLRTGVLVKRPKPGQEMRVDMPAIGPRSVSAAAAAGLSGIAVLAGGALSLERAELIRSADAEGMFVVGAADRRAGDVAPGLARSSRWHFSTVGIVRPTAVQLEDAVRGAELLDALAPLCHSGGTVIDRGHVLAIESDEGVAALIARAGNLRQWGRRRWSKRSAMVVVSSVVAADIVSVLTAAAAAHMAGVAVAGCSMIDLAHGIETAERHKLFLIAAPRQDSAS